MVKLTNKDYFGIIIALSVILIFINMFTRPDRRPEVYKNIYKSIIIKSELNGSGRSINYYTNKQELINLYKVDTLFIGDSIFKSPNSFRVEVYRKNSKGDYEFYKIYELF